MYFKQEQFKNAGHGGNMNDNNQGAQNNSNANQTLDLKKTKICPVIKQGVSFFFINFSKFEPIFLIMLKSIFLNLPNQIFHVFKINLFIK